MKTLFKKRLSYTLGYFATYFAFVVLSFLPIGLLLVLFYRSLSWLEVETKKKASSDNYRNYRDRA